ncbi:xyloside xylosyltransferase 1 isoform X1 [Microcaecilia unicolor]|uniref:Xyloside xylosyltransferase 1 n=1 Tax=Microcaecilia unicolor TaxID=1415580 RepID=A0A6P7YWF4_9AMPH|nr:xyloside xylosyltransferase 1-like isoform X1 [Microcaecilia unicolor]
MVGRLCALRSHHGLLLLAVALAVCALYYSGSEPKKHSSSSKEDQAARSPSPESEPGPALSKSMQEQLNMQDLHLLMMYTKADKSPALGAKFRLALGSLLRSGKLEASEVLNLHFVTDEPSKEVAKTALRDLLQGVPFKYKVIFHDVNTLTEKLFPIVEAMQKHFSAGSGTYYSDSIFFLSVAMHRIMPKEIPRLIQLDLDLKYKSNIRELFEEFDNFPINAVIGVAHEMQPVYRHTFWQYRRENPDSKVGSPPPDGLPGFNSGVILLNLEAMRQSKLYNQLLEPSEVQRLTEKYHFRGHLGDQDFFTTIGMEHAELFHILDCVWNRQLCTWWRDHGYREVFDFYYRCEGHIKILHGNCNTPIPED